jgi:hypothetical protein
MSSLDVLILTQDNCGFCEEATRLFQRLAHEFPLSIATLAINSPAGQKFAEQGGILFPPGIFVGGGPLCYGRPSERMIRCRIEGKLSIGARARCPQFDVAAVQSSLPLFVGRRRCPLTGPVACNVKFATNNDPQKARSSNSASMQP